MWEAISTVLTSKNTWMVLVFLAVLIALIAFLAKVGAGEDVRICSL